MQRFLALLSSAALLTAVAQAQCPQGATAGLVKWTSGSGYAATNPLDDESITSPPIALSSPFFMPGATGTLDQLWVNCNGEMYLTDSTLGLLQPVTGASFGISSLAEMRGTTATASARIAVLSGDQQGSVAVGANWNISVDQSVLGEVRVTWIDLRRFGNATDKYSFTARLIQATGVVECSYGTTFPSPATSFTGRYVGISIGQNVGTTTSPNQDLSVAGTTSGTVGLLYQTFTASVPNVWDLAGNTLTISPNGTGGYITSALVPYVPPTCASNTSFGPSCYSVAGNNSFFQVFVDAPTAKLALDGNAMTLTKGATGYTATWNAGGGGPANFVNGGGQVPLVFADDDDGDVGYTPTFGAIPIPGGTAPTVRVSVNGILTMAATANNLNDFSPASADMVSVTAAPNLAFYGAWNDMLLSDTAPAVNGTISSEEVGNMLYISWNACEAYPTAVANTSTWQYQVNMTTGDVVVVWDTMDPNASTADRVVGATLTGAGATPGAVVLSTGLPVTLSANQNPLTLSVTGRPVITGIDGPTTPMTFTATNVPESIPNTGIGFSLLIFSGGFIPGGLELGPLGVDIGAPGCFLNIASLDVILSMTSTAPTASFTFATGIPASLTASLHFYSQVVSFFPYFGLPNGQNVAGLLFSNGQDSNFQFQ